MPTITDATVVAQAYNTSGNGGRKIVRLDNGWLVSVVKTNGFFYFYKTEKGDWTDKVQLCWIESTAIANNDISIINKGNVVYAISGYGGAGTQMIFFKIDALMQTNVNIFSQNALLDNNQTALGSVSLAINEAKTELHATWASENSTYPNSFNIRYAKGTINGDGSVTWGAVTQLTTNNGSSYHIKDPSISLDKNGTPVILASSQGVYGNVAGTITQNTSARAILAFTYDGISTQQYTAVGWKCVNVDSNTSSYDQSSPSVIYVPQSINGLANGLIANVWHGTDSTSSGVNYIRFSKSIDGGTTWSTMQKLVPGTNASLTVNKAGKLFITYEDAGVVKRIESTDNGDTWSSATTVGNGTNPSTLFDLSMSFSTPLTIRKGASSVLFSGAWTVTTISVAPGDIGQIQDKNNILSYSITTDGEMSTITEKINGTVVNTRTATSGQAVKLGLTQAQWDAIRFGRYADATGGKNTLTVEMGSDKWAYTFDKRLATDADIVSAVKATQDSNEVYLPAVKKQLADAINAKGGSVSANADWLTMIGGLSSMSSGRKASGTVTASSTTATFTYTSGTTGSAYHITVTGIPFKPSKIIAKYSTGSNVYESVYDSDVINDMYANNVKMASFNAGAMGTQTNYNFKGDVSPAYVDASGFKLPVPTGSGVVYNWWAFE